MWGLWWWRTWRVSAILKGGGLGILCWRISSGPSCSHRLRNERGPEASRSLWSLANSWGIRCELIAHYYARTESCYTLLHITGTAIQVTVWILRNWCRLYKLVIRMIKGVTGDFTATFSAWKLSFKYTVCEKIHFLGPAERRVTTLLWTHKQCSNVATPSQEQLDFVSRIKRCLRVCTSTPVCQCFIKLREFYPFSLCFSSVLWVWCGLCCQSRKGCLTFLSDWFLMINRQTRAG